MCSSGRGGVTEGVLVETVRLLEADDEAGDERKERLGLLLERILNEVLRQLLARFVRACPPHAGFDSIGVWGWVGTCEQVRGRPTGRRHRAVRGRRRLTIKLGLQCVHLRLRRLDKRRRVAHEGIDTVVLDGVGDDLQRAGQRTYLRPLRFPLEAEAVERWELLPETAETRVHRERAPLSMATRSRS